MKLIAKTKDTVFLAEVSERELNKITGLSRSDYRGDSYKVGETMYENGFVGNISTDELEKQLAIIREGVQVVNVHTSNVILSINKVKNAADYIRSNIKKTLTNQTPQTMIVESNVPKNVPKVYLNTYGNVIVIGDESWDKASYMPDINTMPIPDNWVRLVPENKNV